MASVPASLFELYQYVIGGLVSVVTILAGVVAFQYRQAEKVNKARLTERDTLNETVADTVAAIKEMAETNRRRAEVNEKCGDLINQVTIALRLLTDRLDLQHQHANRDLADSIVAVKMLAASVQQLNTNLATGIVEIKSEIKNNG